MGVNRDIALGFSEHDACDRCGAETVTSWINSETINVYLCRSCLKEAIRRTYEGGRIPPSENVIQSASAGRA